MSTAQERRELKELRLGPELAGAFLSPEEFDAVEDCDERYVYELINGVLIVTPIPMEEVRGPNELLGYLLLMYRDQHPQGRALDYTLPAHLVCAGMNRRRADRVIWAGLGRLPDFEHDVPAIVVEYVSRGRRNRERDYVAKRDEYLGCGVAEYWIIDRFLRRMTVHRGPARPETLVVGEAETYRTPLLPGFELPLGRVLEEADRIREARRQARKKGRRG